MKQLLLILLCFPMIGFGQNPYIVKANTEEIKEEVKLSAEEQFIEANFPFKHITEMNFIETYHSQV